LLPVQPKSCGPTIERAAEAGCSANEIAAITGHTTLKEVGRYAKAAERKLLARSAMERLQRKSGIRLPNQPEKFGKNSESAGISRSLQFNGLAA
jgi:hypothetical protein